MIKFFKLSTVVGVSVFLLSIGSLAERGDGPRGERRGPPAESFDACTSKSSGDSCSFAGRESESISGECVTGRGGDELHCRPEGHDKKDCNKD